MNLLAGIYLLFGLLFSLLFIGFYFFIKSKKMFSNSIIGVGILIIGFLFIMLIIGMSSQLNEVHALFLLMMAVLFLMIFQLMVLISILFKPKKRKKIQKKEVKR